MSTRAIAVLPSTIVAVPRSVRTLAFFSSAPTPLVSRATIASFQAIVLAKSSFGGPIESPMRARAPAASLKAMRRVGCVDQRLRGNAADVEASSSEPVGFDENRVEAELAGADRGDIAAGAAADDENLAAKLVHSSAAFQSRRVVTPAKAGVQAPPPQRAPQAARALLDTRFRGYDTSPPVTPR